MIEQITDAFNVNPQKDIETRLNAEYKLQNKDNSDETIAHIKITDILSNPLRDTVMLYEIEELRNGTKEIKKITKPDLEILFEKEGWLKI